MARQLDTPYRHKMVCSLQQEQCDTAVVRQTDYRYLNVSSYHLAQIKRLTGEDACPQSLRAVVLEGWPDRRKETLLAHQR